MNKAQYVIGMTEEMIDEIDAKKAAVGAGLATAGVAGAKHLLGKAGQKFKQSIEQGTAGAGMQKVKKGYQTAKEIAGK